MKNKDFDTFSFRPNKSISQSSQSTQKNIEQIPTFNKIQQKQTKTYNTNKNWKQMTYRFQKKNPYPSISSLSGYQNKYNEPKYQSQYINLKIQKMDQQLSENIKRRIQLENKLYQDRVKKQQKLNQQYFRDNYVKSDQEVAQIYTKLEEKTDYIDKNMGLRGNQKQENNSSVIQKPPASPPIPLNISTTLISQKKKQKLPQSSPKLLPNPIKLQQLISQVTFPTIPTKNLQQLHKKIIQLAINSQHSDICYLQMVINFHLQNYLKVRKYFKEIQMFKVYEKKALWVAAQAQFQMQEYQMCLKIVEQCIKCLKNKQLDDKCLPRLLYLNARCYEAIGNFINSIVCYNQLIKLKPKIAQFYLQRGIIYDKIGYPQQSKQDLAYFNILQPQAYQYLKQKILTQQNEIKRKQLIKVLAKLS